MERSELGDYAAGLYALPFIKDVKVKSGGRDKGRDARVILVTPSRTFELSAQLKRSHLGREAAHHILGLARGSASLIVFAPYVGRELGDMFEQAGVNFIDLAGNAFLRLGDQYVARIQGKSAPTAPTERAMRAPAFRVLFALLAEPSLVSATTRVLGEAAGGVSPQTARDARLRFVESGLVLASNRSFQWAPGGRGRAFEQWTAGYASTLYPQLLLGRFRAREKDATALERELQPKLDALHVRWAWGGGAAAQNLTGYYRGTETMVYVEDLPERALALRELGLVPDAKGPVSLLEAPGPAAFYKDSAAVHPLLVYTDLLQEGHQRAWEAASEVRARFHLGEELRP
jgi:hypothetical protein